MSLNRSRAVQGVRNAEPPRITLKELRTASDALSARIRGIARVSMSMNRITDLSITRKRKNMPVIIAKNVRDFPIVSSKSIKVVCSGGCGEEVWVDKRLERISSKVPVFCLDCCTAYLETSGRGHIFMTRACRDIIEKFTDERGVCKIPENWRDYIFFKDWDKHWETNEEPEGARDFAEEMADKLKEFMRGKGIESVADYGCGPATTLFRLAEHFIDIDFYGYDMAASIIHKNTEKAREIGLMNLSFVQDSLPNPRKTKTFDLVTCFATLHYVEKIELAIKRLFERVNPGGYLIFNYPNTYLRKIFQEDIQPDDEEMKRRFTLLLAGRNLISQRRIWEILGARPKKFYSYVKSNIYVLVRKAS